MIGITTYLELYTLLCIIAASSGSIVPIYSTNKLFCYVIIAIWTMNLTTHLRILGMNLKGKSLLDLYSKNKANSIAKIQTSYPQINDLSCRSYLINKLIIIDITVNRYVCVANVIVKSYLIMHLANKVYQCNLKSLLLLEIMCLNIRSNPNQRIVKKSSMPGLQLKTSSIIVTQQR